MRQFASGRVQLDRRKEEGTPIKKLCKSCALTRMRPNDGDVAALAAFAAAEKAKRRLIAEL